MFAEYDHLGQALSCQSFFASIRVQCCCVSSYSIHNQGEMLLLLLLLLFRSRRMNYYLLRKCLAGPLTRMHRSDRTQLLRVNQHHVHLETHVRGRKPRPHTIRSGTRRISSMKFHQTTSTGVWPKQRQDEIWNIDNDLWNESFRREGTMISCCSGTNLPCLTEQTLLWKAWNQITEEEARLFASHTR